MTCSKALLTYRGHSLILSEPRRLPKNEGEVIVQQQKKNLEQQASGVQNKVVKCTIKVIWNVIKDQQQFLCVSGFFLH